MSVTAADSPSRSEPQSAWPARIVRADAAPHYRADYNRLPFQFAHHLADHPLFDVPQIVKLACFLDHGVGGRVTLFSDDAALTQGWQRSRRPGANVRECLADIETSHSWVLMKDIQTHPEYRDLVDRFVSELEQMLGRPVRPSITWIDAYLFVSSPGMVTPYHIDHESNFLFQIAGDKTVNLFDPSDRGILSDDEIERYYVGDFSSARFREPAQQKAMVFELSPGLAVHQPPLAPHWVRTGSQRHSVSLSILFFLREYDAVAKVYQVNHYLRRLGLRPARPGRSTLRDRVKRLVMSDLGYRPRLKTEVVRSGLTKYTAPVSFARKLAVQAISGTKPAPAR